MARSEIVEVGFVVSEKALFVLLRGSGVIAEEEGDFMRVISVPSRDCAVLSAELIRDRIYRGNSRIVSLRCKSCRDENCAGRFIS